MTTERNIDDEITLREYFDMRIDSVISHNESKYSQLDKALGIALDSLNKRLEGMNEFRESLKDQSAKFVTRIEYEAEAGRLKEDIRVLRESKAKLEGKADMSSVYIAYVISAIGIIIGLLKFFIK